MTTTPTITNYLGKIIDNTKELVDDLLERASEVEVDVVDSLGKARSKAADAIPSEVDIDKLREAVASLARQVEKLAGVGKDAVDDVADAAAAAPAEGSAGK